ncbi:hypothetical protein T4D_16031 [Trichinella pseudospiralis]|uniref:Uncharacterized protein n=1 Tax=Trichinella pseudospiralis TaxID=6337 RepID=A0A0V1FL20_TRIPS|nr:hypothetical protein T4D_16031 [Trichinella pseudospiralis]
MDDVELGSASLEIGKMDKQPTHVRDHHWWVAFPVLRQHCSEDVYVGVYIQQERAVKIWVALDSGTHQRILQAGERLFLLQPPAPLHIFLYKDVQRNCHVCEIPDIPPVIGGQPQELPYLLHAPGRGLLLNSLSSPDHSTDCRRDSTPFKHSRGSSSVLWKTIISSRWTRHVFHVRPFSAFSISLKRRRSVPQPEQYDPKSQQSHGSGKRRLLALSFGDFDLPLDALSVNPRHGLQSSVDTAESQGAVLLPGQHYRWRKATGWKPHRLRSSSLDAGVVEVHSSDISRTTRDDFFDPDLRASVMVNFLACQSISLMYWLRKFIPRMTAATLPGRRGAFFARRRAGLC